MQQGGNVGVLKDIKAKLKNENRQPEYNGEICLSNTESLVQVLFKIDDQNHCLTLIGEAHDMTIENEEITGRIQVWSLLSLLNILYRDNIAIYIEMSLPQIDSVMVYDFNYKVNNPSGLADHFDKLIDGIKKKYESNMRACLECSGKKAILKHYDGNDYRIILKKDKLLIIPKKHQSENISYTFYKIYSHNKTLDNIYFIDYRDTLLCSYLIEYKSVNHNNIDNHIFDFLKLSEKILSTEELLKYKQNIVQMIPNKQILYEKYNLYHFIEYYKIIFLFFSHINDSTYLSEHDYFDINVRFNVEDIINNFLLDYCYKNNITKLLDIYIKHSHEKKNRYFENIFLLLKHTCYLFIYILEYFINIYNEKQRDEDKSKLLNGTIPDERINFVTNSNDFIDFKQNQFEIDGTPYSNIITYLLDIDIENPDEIYYWKLIFHIYSRLLDVYTITSIYDNIIDKSKKINYHCMISGNAHSNFIYFLFGWVAKSMESNPIYDLIDFDGCDVTSDSSKYVNIDGLYYPIDEHSGSKDFRQLETNINR